MPTAFADAMHKALASPETKDLDLEWKIQRDGSGLYEAKVNVAGIVELDRDNGVVDALVSVTGILDEVDDVILPGAYERTLKQRIPKGVWSHDWSTWVSRTDKVAELLPGDPSLPRSWKGKPWPSNAGAARVRTAFNLGTQAGKDAFSNIVFFDAGPLGQQVEWSIGYNVPAGDARRNSQGWRLIQHLKWFEYCPVLFGAMPLAGTLANDERERKAAEMGDEGKGAMAAERERIEITGAPVREVAPDVAAQVKAAIDPLLAAAGLTLTIAPAGWTPSEGELKAAHAAAELEAKVAGREASPGDVAATERLKHYWAHGEGAAKIEWGRPGDFDRCVHELSKYMHNPAQVKGYCALRHHEATGAWPGHAPTEQVPGHGGGDHGHKEIPMTESTAAAEAAAAAEQKQTAPGTAPGSGDPSPETQRTGGQTPPSPDEIVLPEDDDPENKWALPLDAPEDYITGGDEDGEKALELKASGKMKCGKSAADCRHTMKDDSYPIHDAAELGDAVQAYPRGAGKGGKTKADIRSHIVSAAKRLGAKSKVPNTWPEKREGKSIDDEFAEAIERKDYPYLPGSVEERQDALRDALRELLLPEPDENGNVRAWVSLDGTYADRVVCTLNDYSVEPSQEQTFVITYTVGEDGEVAFGTPQAVDKVVSIVPDPDYTPDVGDADTVTSPPPDGVLGGANPLLPIGRKIDEQAKILLAALEGKDDAGAATAEKPSATHARRLKAAHRALTGALLGMGIPLPVTVQPTAEDVGDTDATGRDTETESKALLELAAAAELVLLD